MAEKSTGNRPPVRAGLSNVGKSSNARQAEPQLPWWAPNGSAAIPTAMLDPTRCSASPMVPALQGSGSPKHYSAAAFTELKVSISAIV